MRGPPGGQTGILRRASQTRRPPGKHRHSGTFLAARLTGGTPLFKMAMAGAEPWGSSWHQENANPLKS